MTIYWTLGFITGLCIGAPFGFLIMGLCVAAKKGEQ